jgi:hypothetical protein
MGLMDDAREAWVAEQQRRAQEAAREAARRNAEDKKIRRAAEAAAEVKYEGPARRALRKWQARLGVTAENVSVVLSPNEFTLKWEVDDHVFWVKSHAGGVSSVFIERWSPPTHFRKLGHTEAFPADTLEQIGYALSDQALKDREAQLRPK